MVEPYLKSHYKNKISYQKKQQTSTTGRRKRKTGEDFHTHIPSYPQHLQMIPLHNPPVTQHANTVYSYAAPQNTWPTTVSCLMNSPIGKGSQSFANQGNLSGYGQFDIPQSTFQPAQAPPSIINSEFAPATYSSNIMPSNAAVHAPQTTAAGFQADNRSNESVHTWSLTLWLRIIGQPEPVIHVGVVVSATSIFSKLPGTDSTLYPSNGTRSSF